MKCSKKTQNTDSIVGRYAHTKKRWIRLPGDEMGWDRVHQRTYHFTRDMYEMPRTRAGVLDSISRGISSRR